MSVEKNSAEHGCPNSSNAPTVEEQEVRDALETLRALEDRLAEVLEDGKLSEGALISEYHLPMIEAALDAGEVSRADALIERVREEHVPKADMAKWWAVLWGAHWVNDRLDDAEEGANRAVAWAREAGDAVLESQSYCRLGQVCQFRGDYDAAADWAMKALTIEKELGRDNEVLTIHQLLGVISHERGDLNGAERWTLKALALSEKTGHAKEGVVAQTHLSWVAQERGDLDDAERMLMLALADSEKLDDASITAPICRRLGLLAEERDDLDAADRWRRREVACYEEVGDLLELASTCADVIVLAGKRGDMETAGSFYDKVDGVSTWQGRRDMLAHLCQIVLWVAGECEDLDAIEKWGRKMLSLGKECGETEIVANAYYALGNVALERENNVRAVRMLGEAIVRYGRVENEDMCDRCMDLMWESWEYLTDQECSEMSKVLVMIGMSPGEMGWMSE